MEQPIKIGLLGAGTVGSGVLQVLRENAKEVFLKAGAPVEIKSVLVRDAKKARPNTDGLIVTDRIEDILDEDEEVLVTLSPDKRDYILEAFFKTLPFVVLWAAFDTFFIVMMFKTNAFENVMIIWFTIFFFSIHLIPVWLYIANIIKRIMSYKNVQYYLTDRRVIIRSGMIGIDYKMFFYSDISSEGRSRHDSSAAQLCYHDL